MYVCIYIYIVICIYIVYMYNIAIIYIYMYHKPYSYWSFYTLSELSFGAPPSGHQWKSHH